MVSKANAIRARNIMTSNPITIDADETVSKAIAKMKTNFIHELPVLKNGKLVGVISMDTLFKRRNIPLNTKIDNVYISTPKLDEDSTYQDIANRLFSTGFRAIPVIDKKEMLVGMVSRTDLIKVFRHIPEMEKITVRDVYTPNPKTVREADDIHVALSYMKELEEHSLPVVNKAGKLAGVVGLSDIAKYFQSNKITDNKTRIEDEKNFVVEIKGIMRSSPICTSLDSTLSEVSSLMDKEKVTTIFIVDKSQAPIGVISQYDLLSMMVENKNDKNYVHLSITGNLEEELFAEMDAMISKSMNRISKISEPRMLNVHISKFSNKDNTVYEVQSKLSLVNKAIIGTAKHWNVFKATDETLREIETQVRKEKDKAVSMKKRGK